MERSEKRILEELAEFVVELSIRDLPKNVIRQGNRCLLDLLGCVYGALNREGTCNLLDMAVQINPKPEATVWGTGKKAGMAEAALAHGCLGYHLEFDDGISLGAHWGSETIPAAIAAAEFEDRGGEALITAMVVAYEVGNRVSRAFSNRMLSRGIHFPCAMGAFGAAAGVAKIMDLSAAETVKALGNACLSPIAPYGPAFSGAPIKDAYSGWPNALGISMVRMAQAGWGGPDDLLEGPEGLGHVLGWEGSVRELRSQILDGLGSAFEIMKTYFKPYPCCRWLHAPVKAILEMREKGGWRSEDIDTIQVKVPQFMMMYDKKGIFHHEIKARYSMPYTAAASALWGRLGVEEFEASKRFDPALARLAKRVTLEVDPALNKAFPEVFETQVTVYLTSGHSETNQCGLPWGPENPPSDLALEDKFSYLTGKILDPERIASWLDLFQRGIESDKTLSALLGLLSTRLVPPSKKV
jgi:2-methylcitrate dehydratase PrpD